MFSKDLTYTVFLVLSEEFSNAFCRSDLLFRYFIIHFSPQVCVDLGAFSDVIMCCHRLVDLGRKQIDNEVIFLSKK